METQVQIQIHKHKDSYLQIKQFQFDESIPSTVLSVLLDVGGGWMGGVGEQDLQRGTKVRL